MKKTLLLITSIIVNVYSFGQITISNSAFPNAGLELYMSTANDPAIDIATTGANQNWDFSGLTRNGQDTFFHAPLGTSQFLTYIQFGAFAPQKFRANYYRPSTNLPISQITSLLPLPVSIDNLFAYTQVNADSVSIVGYALRVNGTDVAFRSDSIEKLNDLAMNFQDVWSSKSKSILDFNPIFDARFLQRRNHSAVVDGWGSITTPFGTFQALRTKHTIIERDSLRFTTTLPFIGLTTVNLPINLPLGREYEWRTPGLKEAVLRIRTSEIAGQEVVNRIEYFDLNQFLALEEDKRFGFSMYPNPTSDLLYISLEKEASLIQVKTLEGKIVMELKEAGLNYQINTINLSSGVYFLEIEFDGKKAQRKFVKN